MKEGASGGIGFAGALFLVFLVLKLCGVIGWSWWWVTSPLWIPPLAFCAILLAVGLLVGFVFLALACFKK